MSYSTPLGDLFDHCLGIVPVCHGPSRSSSAVDGATELFLILDKDLVAKAMQSSGYATGAW